MASATHETIQCGQGRQCQDCQTFKNLPAGKDTTFCRFTQNAMGRCDFYNGPGMVIRTVTVEDWVYSAPLK